MDTPPPPTGPNAYAAYMVVAGASAASSVLIILIAINKFNQITDSGMWAIAWMGFAPAILGIGVSGFIYLAARGKQTQELAPRSLPPLPQEEIRFRSTEIRTTNPSASTDK